MKQIRFANAALALALTLTLAACHSPAPAETLPPSAPPRPAETAGPVQSTPTPPPELPVWGEQTFSRAFCAGDGTPVLQVSYTLPMVQNAAACPAGAAINAWYQAEGQARLTEAEEQHEAQVADYDVSSALGFSFQPTVEEMRSEVVYEAQGIISIRRELYVSFGGAHPTVYRLSEQFHAETGEKLAFADFFTDADTVMGRVADAFWETELGEGALSREEVAVACHPENFYCTEEGYVFWIQGGSLPAVNSPLEVTIPWDRFADVSRYG